MTRDELQAEGLVRIRKLSRRMLIGYTVIILAAILTITIFAVRKYDRLVKDKVNSMTYSLNAQLKLNLDSYLSRMENVATLAFSVDNAYTYDPTTSTLSESEAIDVEKQISSDLLSLCLMENMVDYGIVYSTNQTVGKISNGTIQLFGDSLYTDLSSMITRERTSDGWTTGYNDDYERIYYVKRINENAVFAISFYTAELDKIFASPDTIKDMTIRLTDRSYKMIYSSDKDQLGSSLPDDVLGQVKGHDTAVISDDDMISTVNLTNGDWYVICSTPTDVILKEARDMQKYIYIAALAAALVALAAGFFFIRKIADPVSTVTSTLSDEISEDEFDGVLGNRFFRDKCEALISKTPEKELRSFAIVDIDNFFDLIDATDRKTAAAQISKLLKIFENIFGDAECIGRLGEDTFAVITSPKKEEPEMYKALLAKRCTDICSMFRETLNAHGDSPFEATVSIGAAVCPTDGNNYRTVCDNAYKALHISKKTGKNKQTIYSEGGDLS